MDRRLRPLAVFVTACTFGAAAALPIPAAATLVKAVPLAIETEGAGCGTGSFTLTYHPLTSAQVTDRGFARRSVADQTVGRRGNGTGWRRLAGTELLAGARGTLTLRWSGVQRKSNGQWGNETGTWSIVSGTGIYTGRSGSGRFTASSTTARYQGLLVVAQ
jgi:hypothetical protein